MEIIIRDEGRSIRFLTKHSILDDPVQLQSLMRRMWNSLEEDPYQSTIMHDPAVKGESDEDKQQ